jgi:RNA polymerase sigma-70 factor (ECF subfamily)
MNPEPDTNQLVAMARAGDERARDRLLTRYSDRLRRMIRAFLDPRLSARIDATDVLQDAMTRAAVKLPDYLEHQPIAFYPWLRQIVQEEMIMAHRRHIGAKRRTVMRENRFDVALSEASAVELADILVTGESTPSSKARKAESRRQIQKALRQLAESEQQVLVMRYVEQLKIREIADVLGISEASAKSRVRRALEKLNDVLDHDDKEHTE